MIVVSAELAIAANVAIATGPALFGVPAVLCLCLMQECILHLGARDKLSEREHCILHMLYR